MYRGEEGVGVRLQKIGAEGWGSHLGLWETWRIRMGWRRGRGIVRRRRVTKKEEV